MKSHTHTHMCVGGWGSISLPWLRQLVAGPSELMAGFDHRSARVRFVVDEVAVGEVSLQVNDS